MPRYKLYYFDTEGRAETIRLLFAYAGVEYEDIRVPYAEWATRKNGEWAMWCIFQWIIVMMWNIVNVRVKTQVLTQLLIFYVPTDFVMKFFECAEIVSGIVSQSFVRQCAQKSNEADDEWNPETAALKNYQFQQRFKRQ